MADVTQIFQMSELGWSTTTRATYTSGMGMAFLFGGQLSKFTMQAFGPDGHTTVSHAVCMAQLLLQGMVKQSWAWWLALLLRWVGDNRFTAVKATCADLAVRSGMGKGEYNGLAANLRAACVVVSPLVYGKLFTFGQARQRPEMVFYGVTAFIMAAETVLRCNQLHGMN